MWHEALPSLVAEGKAQPQQREDDHVIDEHFCCTCSSGMRCVSKSTYPPNREPPLPKEPKPACWPKRHLSFRLFFPGRQKANYKSVQPCGRQRHPLRMKHCGSHPPLPFIVHVVRGILPERASIAVIPEGRIQFFGGQTGWWPVAYDRAAGTVFSAVQMHTILLALSRSFSEYTGKSGDVFLLMMSLFWLRRSEGYAKNSRNFFLCSQAPVIP